MAAEARSFVFKTTVFEDGIRLRRYLLKTNAYCVVLRPLFLTSGESTARSAVDDAIHGDRVSAQAEKFDGPVVQRGSSTHKIQKYRLAGHCFCVVTRPLTGLHSS